MEKPEPVSSHDDEVVSLSKSLYNQVELIDSFYAQLVDQLKSMDSQISQQVTQMNKLYEELDDCKSLIRVLQNENNMLRKKLNSQ